jgi:hypothetical protein
MTPNFYCSPMTHPKWVMEEARLRAIPPTGESRRRTRGGHHARGVQRGVVEALVELWQRRWSPSSA